jgi:glucose-6-phosphate isomerase
VRPLKLRPARRALVEHQRHVGSRNLRQLFADDALRGECLVLQGGADLHLDYSKSRVTDETMAPLQQLARECGVAERIEQMFDGRLPNNTEQRAALHVALRAPAGEWR